MENDHSILKFKRDRIPGCAKSALCKELLNTPGRLGDDRPVQSLMGDLIKEQMKFQFQTITVKEHGISFPAMVSAWIAWLLFLYTGLAMRENILRANGNDIRPCCIALQLSVIYLCGLFYLCRAMRLNESDLLREYTGQRYEIETPMTSWVGKIPEDPHPVAPSISSRVMVELGMVIAVIIAVAALVDSGVIIGAKSSGQNFGNQ
ncbi:hypothetical protein PVK06_016477 [Gossypium arboreum]|uniref:Uncharacterized protein n=1 Tax=Gossypium arboreum TaxID=29729 RepID=A0ABR0Q020_GOSAR|nr:hypothetical protein PVK06_016477 [Gossypium arboreum]